MTTTRNHRTSLQTLFVLGGLAVVAASNTASAAIVTIDFESLALNTAVSNQFLAQGVLFSSPGNPTQPEINNFSSNSTTGKVLADFSVVGGFQIDAAFTAPIASVSAIVYANSTALITMQAFDVNSVLLGQVTSLGGSINQGMLSLSGVGAISRVSWTTNNAAAAVGIDNLTFVQNPVFAQTTPEPATFGMMLGAFGVLAFLRKTKAVA